MNRLSQEVRITCTLSTWHAYLAIFIGRDHKSRSRSLTMLSYEIHHNYWTDSHVISNLVECRLLHPRCRVLRNASKRSNVKVTKVSYCRPIHSKALTCQKAVALSSCWTILNTVNEIRTTHYANMYTRIVIRDRMSAPYFVASTVSNSSLNCPAHELCRVSK